MQDLTKKPISDKKIEVEKKITGKSKLVSINLPEILVARCQGVIASRKTAGDFMITSLSDLIRQSLLAYQNGMNLAGARIEGNAPKRVNVTLNEELFNYYQSLPPKSRWEIVERSLIGFLNNL